MIRPTKHLDLQSCVLQLSHIILRELANSRALPLRDIESIIDKSAPPPARRNLVATLTLLHGLGLVDYDLQTDALYLTVPRAGGRP